MIDDGTTLRIVIPGEPVAQGRGKVGVIKLKSGAKRGSIRDPEKSRNWKAEVRYLMAKAVGEGRIAFPTGPLSIVLILRFSGPASDHRKRTPAPWRWRPRKPDASNVLKGVEDAGNGVIWADDSQIVHLEVLKTDAAHGEQPGCVLIVGPAESGPAGAMSICGAGLVASGWHIAEPKGESK